MYDNIQRTIVYLRLRAEGADKVEVSFNSAGSTHYIMGLCFIRFLRSQYVTHRLLSHENSGYLIKILRMAVSIFVAVKHTFERSP